MQKKTQLAPTVKGISNQASRLFNSAKYVLQNNLKVSIKEITDPTDFINYLQKAYAVKRFIAQIPKPNAFDVDKDFTEPFQRTIKESNANKGKSELIGDNLNSSTLESIVRTVASLGSDATAILKEDSKSRATRKRLKGNIVTIQLEDVEISEDWKNGISKIRAKYAKIKKEE